MEIKIIPAMLPQAYKAIELSMDKVHEYVNRVQLDIVDGHFAHNRTWLFNGKDEGRLEAIMHEELGMPYWDTVDYELDLMVKDPLERMDVYMALGPAKMIFHVEGLNVEKMKVYFETLPDIIKETISFGMAIGIDTDPALIAPFISYIDTIQCMGIAQVGFQGQPFDERVYGQIAKVKEMYPEKTIAVDGAVDLSNIGALAKAGVTTFVVGSAIFQSLDARGTIDALCKQATASAN